AFRSVFADQYVIPSGSMEPTLQPGDHVLVNKMAYDLRVPFSDQVIRRTGEPERGDVIVFTHPGDPSVNLIKRLVGLPGDRVRILDGLVELNGKTLELEPAELGSIRERLASTSLPFEYRERLGVTLHDVKRIPGLARHQEQEFLVPEGHYLFLGDNRDNSADSREWGMVPRQALRGKALRVLYSVSWKDTIPSLVLDRTARQMQN
ncbi:MAG: signal peptidase I, partial [Oligoflexia bacterium]|nr:signal peptidase I [Oligoflexia bacterium]